MMKNITLLFILFISSLAFSQDATVTITTTNPANSLVSVANISAGGTFDVVFDYVTDQDIVLTAQIEFVSFGGTSSSYAVPETIVTFDIDATTDPSGTLTATLTFPTTNPIVGSDIGPETTWTFPGGDDNIETTRGLANSITTIGAGASGGMRVKFSTDNAGDTVTGSAGNFPLGGGVTNIEFRDLDFDDIDGVTVPVVTTTDAWAWNPVSPADIIQDSSIDIPITYTSEETIAAGGIIFDLFCVSVRDNGSGGNAFNAVFMGQYSNEELTTTGTDVSTNIAMTSFPASYVDANGHLMTKDELLAANPHGDTPTPTNYYFELRPLTGSDANFTPPALPPNSFISFIENGTASNQRLNFSSVKVYPNPTNSILNISGIKDTQTITIHNILGQQVKKFKNQETINVSDLTNGIYFLQTDNGLKRKILVN